MPSIHQITTLLHSPKDWKSIAQDKGAFYRYTISKGDHVAFFFGTNHARDPQNGMYPLLKDFFTKFSTHADPRSTIVLMEGGVRTPSPTLEESIIKNAEGGAIAFWSKELGYAVESIEPTTKEQVARLEERFTKDEIAYYYFIRMVHQWKRTHGDPVPFEAYIEKSLERDAKNFDWQGYDHSLEHMKELHQRFFDTSFEEVLLKNTEQILDLFVGIKDTTRINQVGAELSEIRNRVMVEKVVTAWREGKSVFAALGDSHVILQERALRALLI